MSAGVDRHAATLSRDGWCVFARAVEPDLIAPIEADLNPRFVATPLCQGGFYGERTGRFGSLLTRRRSAVHKSQLQSLMRITYAVCCWNSTKTGTQRVCSKTHSADTI